MSANHLSPAERARFNMVEQQIRPWDVLEQTVLDRLFAVPREQFVPEALRAHAFVDMEIPLRINGVDTGEVMLAPKLEARLLQELQLTPECSVLEVGTGSGYQAALIAGLARQVTSVERLPVLAAYARDRLQASGISNVTVVQGDAHAGWGSAEYDRILLTGSLPVVPEALKLQLKVGGQMVLVVGEAPIMRALRLVRRSASTWETVSLFDTLIPPLHGAHTSRFRF